MAGRKQGGLVSEKKLPPKLQLAAADGVRIESAATAVKPEPPSKPDSLPSEVSQLWDEVVEALNDAGLISQVDGPAIELALRHFAAARFASDQLLREGSTKFDAKNEREMKNPAAVVFSQQSSAFLDYAKQLGLTFVSRARANTDGGANEQGGTSNPFELHGHG